jgi:hypothetical protein
LTVLKAAPYARVLLTIAAVVPVVLDRYAHAMASQTA